MLTGFLEIKSLKGAYIPHKKIKLLDSTWFAGDFQREYELYLNDTIGFHQDFIRIRNQIDYSLFNKCHSYDIEVGKNGYLIATSHIDYHLGKIHTRETKIDSTVTMLQQINDSLAKRNKTLVILFAPNRGAYYKELTPPWYDLRKVHESDYECYIRLLSKTNVNVLDCYQWFLSEKSKAKFPLFTKCGIHWSVYGAALAGDSLVRWIENKRGVDMPDVNFDEIELSTKARNDDADLNNAINLIWDIKNDLMAYPKLKFNKSGKAKIKKLFVGDSFFFNMGATSIPDNAFGEYAFWYYNNTIFSNNPTNGKTVGALSLKEELEKYDVITIISTEINLKDLGWGFIRNMWNTYCNPESNRIAFYIEKIKADSVWFDQVKQKAKAKNISLEEQLRQDAMYVLSIEKH